MNPTDQQASKLIKYVSESENNPHAFGYLTTSLYDTAWVSMIRNPNTSQPTLLFPECYQHLLDKQLPLSGWKDECDLDIDTIISTLGGLLALKKNLQIEHPNITIDNIRDRIENASKYLTRLLNNWKVTEDQRCGSEVVIPSMLEYLEDEGLKFDFPGREALMLQNQKKLSRIPKTIWSRNEPLSIHFNLEAFVKTADFAQLESQLKFGNIGNSPSSTAAYLIHSKGWSNSAESYLRTILLSREPQDQGGIPVIYPTTGFEVTWITATLLENGFSQDQLPGCRSALVSTEYICKGLGGLSTSGMIPLTSPPKALKLMISLATWGWPDADDTAKCITARNLLGVETDIQPLLRSFEREAYFLTLLMERDPSLSCNCNVLTALLSFSNPSRYTKQIEKCAIFLCKSWLIAEDSFRDKWHTSEYYPIMLMSEGLMQLWHLWDRGDLDPQTPKLLDYTIPLVLLQVLTQTLDRQNDNGSWGAACSREITAYAIIALANLAAIPFATFLGPEIDLAITKGRYFINSTNDGRPDWVWIGKTVYSPVKVSEAYIVAALKTTYPKFILKSFPKNVDLSEDKIKLYIQGFRSLSHLKAFPSWKIQCCVIEGLFLLNKIKNQDVDATESQLSCDESLEDEKLLESLSIAICCINMIQGFQMQRGHFVELLKYTITSHGLETYMKITLRARNIHEIEKLKTMTRDLFRNHEFGMKVTTKHDNSSINGDICGNATGFNVKTNDHTNGHTNGYTCGHSNGHTKRSVSAGNFTQEDDLQPTFQRLRSFIKTVLVHPAVIVSSKEDQEDFKTKLEKQVLSHLNKAEIGTEPHLENGSLFNKSPHAHLQNWWQSILPSHYDVETSLAFLRCLLYAKIPPPKQCAFEIYLLHDLRIRLAFKVKIIKELHHSTGSQQEKSLGSAAASKIEVNIKEATKTVQLLKVMELEGRHRHMAYDALEDLLGSPSPELISLRFIDLFTELWQQIDKSKDH